jgi:hypothetical protein
MFDGAFAVVIIREGVRTRYDSWTTASACVSIGDEVHGYMPDGSTGWLAVVPLDDPDLGPSRWRAVVMPLVPPHRTT